MQSQNSSGKALYRPDIDGLRAIAVLAVVLFHFDVGALAGGFIGVDIFFVISGFLIAGILRAEIRHGRFALTAFYERRIRRILPALLVVLAATGVSASFILLPTDLEKLGTSTIATALFASNLYFWRTTGYFDPGHEFNPLLHVWSLAVEEQYYLFFPVALAWLVRRSARWTSAGVGAAALLSLALCVALQPTRPDAVFYLLPFRMWELLAGAWLATADVPPITQPIMRTVTGASGLALLMAAIALIPAGPDFPGWQATLPVAGTLLAIHAGTSGANLASSALASRPLVAVGLISYSLYLWHWPVITLARYRLGDQLGPGWQLGLLGAVFALAFASYRYVEVPLRRRAGPPLGTLAVTGIAAGVVGAGILIGMLTMAGDGWASRYSPPVLAADRARSARIPFLACNDRRMFYEAAAERDIRLAGLCRIGKPSGPPTAILWGDSHALAWAPAVDTVLKERGIAGVLAIKAECPPLPDLIDRRDARCGAFNTSVRDEVIRSPDIDLVILAAVWPSYVAPATPGRLADRADPDQPWDFGAVLARTLDDLTARGRQTWVLGPVPRAPDDPGFAIASNLAFGRPLAPGTSTAQAVNAAAPFWQAVASHQRSTGVRATLFSNPTEWLCTGARCRFADDAGPWYRDGGHLNVSGAAALVPALRLELDRAVGQARSPLP
jgi:peptidoglycan/LPS O-acetylase OafA/YrhL